MTITPRNKGFMVYVTRASAKEGYRKIRKMRSTHEEAVALHQEIDDALTNYGKWPVEEGDELLPVQAIPGIHTQTVSMHTPRSRDGQGTLREATTLALKTHWEGMEYHRVVNYTVWPIVSFMETERKKFDIDEIISEDIDKLVTHYKDKGLTPSTINKALGALRIINQVALKRIPPLATITIPVPHVPGRRIEKWWLRPEDQERATSWLRKDQGDDLFADLIEVLVYQGLRVQEGMRLQERNFTGLVTDTPWLKVPGTKTNDSQDSIPVYPEALPVILRAIERAKVNKWSRLFPLTDRQAQTRWNDVREFLGVTNVKTATMKSLRRTFAWYANNRKMPTATLQKVLRHRGIGTTAGYLDLVGGGEVGDSRKYFADNPTPVQTQGNFAELIKAYRDSGATPEETARFAKGLMG